MIAFIQTKSGGNHAPSRYASPRCLGSCTGGRAVGVAYATATITGKDVVDGNMVSATGWTDLAEWSRAFMEVLERAAVPA